MLSRFVALSVSLTPKVSPFQTLINKYERADAERCQGLAPMLPPELLGGTGLTDAERRLLGL